MGNPVIQPSMPVPVVTPAVPPVTTTQESVPFRTPAATADPEEHFSASDAARVVMRGLATVTECLCFAGRTVTIYAIKLGALVAGGIKGVLRYAHESENLHNRTVQPVQCQTDRQTPATVVSGQMPLEEYVMADAIRTANAVPESIPALEFAGGVACAVLVPWFLFGPLGMAVNIPRLVGVKPFPVIGALSNNSRQATPQDHTVNRQSGPL